ncbi:glycosyltransferase [Thiobacter aerophilum]|uniref:Glycosyltransferase n=1 Tax=Thiobacter aerophilum TaxID=3121275 RepID=A0ABV0EEB7_9BURK
MDGLEFADSLPVSRPPHRLHLAWVTETYPPEINGVAMTVGRLVDGLRRRGHGVQLIRPRQHPADVPSDTQSLEEVLTPGLPLPRYDELRIGLPAGTRLKRLWRARRPDLVHITTEGPLGWSALKAARALGVPVTSSFHTNFHIYSRHYGFGWLKRPIEAYLRHFHNRTALTLVPTKAMRRELSQLGFRRLNVLARGVDTQLFTPQRRSDALRASWGARPDTPVVLYVGRLAPEKNLPLLLAAYDALRARRPDARLVLVGDGPLRPALARARPYAATWSAREMTARLTCFLRGYAQARGRSGPPIPRRATPWIAPSLLATVATACVNTLRVHRPSRVS